YAVPMAPFIAVGGINPWTNETVADVRAGRKGSVGIRTVVRIDVSCKIDAFPASRFNELFDYMIVLGASIILDANGNLRFRALRPYPHTSHVYGEKFCDIRGDGRTAAVPDFFKDGDVLIYFPGKDDLFFLNVLRISQQDSSAQLVVQKAAFDETGGSQDSPWVKADEASVHDAKSKDILFALNYLIQEYLDGVVVSLRIPVLRVDMDRSVLQLAGAVINSSIQGVDTAVLSLGILGHHTAHIGET